MALKNVNIPLNIQDYPNTNNNSSSTYIGVNSLLNNSSDNQNLVTITNYLPSDQSYVNISKMINGIIVGPTTNLSNIQNSIIVGSTNISSSSLAGSQVSASNILAVGSYLEIPNASNCAILGVGNDPDVQNPLFIIGNGITFSSNHNIVEVTTDSVHISPSRSNAVTVDITGTGVNIIGATTITGGATIGGLLTIGDEDNGTTTIDMNKITTSILNTNSIKVRSGDSISIESPVNLNNNTISGGATLTGTYTFDSVNGLKIGTSTINSSNESVNLTLPRYSGTLALAKTLYNYTITFGFEIEGSNWNYGGLSGNNSYRGVISFNINLINNGTIFDNFLGDENFKEATKEATDNFSDIWMDILGAAAGKSSAASGYILQIVNGEPRKNTSNLYFINNVRGEKVEELSPAPISHYNLYAFGIRFAQYAFTERADQKYLPILTANTDPSFALPQGVSNGEFKTLLSDVVNSMTYQGISPSNINYISIHKETINF